MPRRWRLVSFATDPRSSACPISYSKTARSKSARPPREALAATLLPEAVPYFIEAMADSFWWYERENAAGPLLDALTKFGTDAVEPLIGALMHNEGTVRRSAAILLGRIGDTRAVEPLGMALYDMHDEVGRAAAGSLAGFGAAALGVLSEALKHPEAGIRLHAVWALTRIKDARVLPLLAGMLKDPDRHVVKQVIQSLGELHDPRAAHGVDAHR